MMITTFENNTKGNIIMVLSYFYIKDLKLYLFSLYIRVNVVRLKYKDVTSINTRINCFNTEIPFTGTKTPNFGYHIRKILYRREEFYYYP